MLGKSDSESLSNPSPFTNSLCAVSNACSGSKSSTYPHKKKGYVASHLLEISWRGGRVLRVLVVRGELIAAVGVTLIALTFPVEHGL